MPDMHDRLSVLEGKVSVLQGLAYAQLSLTVALITVVVLR